MSRAPRSSYRNTACIRIPLSTNTAFHEYRFVRVPPFTNTALYESRFCTNTAAPGPRRRPAHRRGSERLERGALDIVQVHGGVVESRSMMSKSNLTTSAASDRPMVFGALGRAVFLGPSWELFGCPVGLDLPRHGFFHEPRSATSRPRRSRAQ